jgi:hypothetical protein
MEVGISVVNINIITDIGVQTVADTLLVTCINRFTRSSTTNKRSKCTTKDLQLFQLTMLTHDHSDTISVEFLLCSS